jgi:superfamily II DNA helicase RecQ
MKVKFMEYKGATVLVVEGLKQKLVIREECVGFTIDVREMKKETPLPEQEEEQETVQELPCDFERVPVFKEEVKEEAPEETFVILPPVGAPSPSEMELFTLLAALRKKISNDVGVPPYVVFHNKTMWEMVRKMPDTLEAMGQIEGIGKVKLEKYGPAFLEILKGSEL